jgi:hypothetical protein
MPIGTLFEADGFTEQQYDAVLERVQQVLGDAGPGGCLVHIAGPTGGGWRVIEVWESEEAQRRFQDDVLNPAFEGAGTPRVTPTLFDVHVVLPPAEVLAGVRPPA